MTVDPQTIIVGLLSIVVTGFGWWLATLAGDVKKANEDLQSHKLYASENYIKDGDLQKLRNELIGHLERIEKLVAQVVANRHRSDAGE